MLIDAQLAHDDQLLKSPAAKCARFLSPSQRQNCLIFKTPSPVGKNDLSFCVPEF
jgi:hypothetical protein